MATARQFARSRALKLAVALCFVSALAFLLGQGVAAFRVMDAQPPTTHTPPQAIEHVSGAQGTTPAPSAPAHAAASSTTSSGTAATPTHAAPVVPVAFSANLTRAAPARHDAKHDGHARGKDKPHAKHKGAAGDSSHGGLAHGPHSAQGAHDANASQPARQPGSGHDGHDGEHSGGHGK